MHPGPDERGRRDRAPTSRPAPSRSSPTRSRTASRSGWRCSTCSPGRTRTGRPGPAPGERSGPGPRDQPGLAGRPGGGPRGTGRDRRHGRDPRGRHVADGRGRRRDRAATGSSSRPGSSTSTPTCASRATRTPRRSRPGWRRPPTAGSRRSARCRTRPRPSTSRACWPGCELPRSASGSPVELLAHGAVTVGRAGEQLAALGELADAGVVGFSDDGVAGPVARRSCGRRSPTRARSGCRSSTTPRSRR